MEGVTSLPVDWAGYQVDPSDDGVSLGWSSGLVTRITPTVMPRVN